MVQSVTPQQAHELMSQGNFDVIDVREPREWVGGHLPGSRLVPLGTLRASPQAVLTRDGVIFVCAAGVRSETAAKLADAIGFSHVYNLTGGTRGWQSASLPLVRD